MEEIYKILLIESIDKIRKKSFILDEILHWTVPIPLVLCSLDRLVIISDSKAPALVLWQFTINNEALQINWACIFISHNVEIASAIAIRFPSHSPGEMESMSIPERVFETIVQNAHGGHEHQT